MTLELLNEHLHILWEYQKAKDHLVEMRASVLGAQQFDGMPHATGVSDKVARLALVLADQEEEVRKLEKAVSRSEKSVRKYVERIPDNRTKLVFNLRFCCGMTWPEVAQTIGGGNSPETVKMTCYRYLMKEHSVESSLAATRNGSETI